MLVLSRKSSQDILFPALGITIRVLRTSSNVVKLGVLAPRHLQVLRGELATCDDLVEAIRNLGQQVRSHDLRSRLNSILLKLELLQRTEKKGLAHESEQAINSVTSALSDLDAEFARLITPPAKDATTSCEALQLLIVDDNHNERELLASVLTLHGFAVRSVADGVAAIHSLNEDPIPDAILLDLQMPRLSGEETLRCIRTDHRFEKIRVIGVSGGHPKVSVLPDGLRGFDAWFSKPLQLSQLVALLNIPGETDLSPA